MKCPNCEYQNGWSGESLDMVDGEHGDFYRLPIDVSRSRAWDEDTEHLYACPACGVAFIQVYRG